MTFLDDMLNAFAEGFGLGLGLLTVAAIGLLLYWLLAS